VNPKNTSFLYENGIIRITGVNLSTLNEAGLFFCRDCPGRPVSQDGFLTSMVYADGNRGMQIYYPWHGGQWHRFKDNNNAWRAWASV